MNGEMVFRRIEVTPISGALGAEIGGVDLSRPLDDDVFAEVHRAFLDNLVIFFRDQHVTPEQHKAFGGRFGQLNVHPHYVPLAGHPEILEVLKEETATVNVGGEWHSDLSCLEKPPLGSILYALEVPPYGGDTLFTNMYLAYERLSGGMRDLLDILVAVHSDRTMSDPEAQDAKNETRSSKLLSQDVGETRSEHPVVRTHPETGRKALFVNSIFTVGFKGMTAAESRPLLQFVFDQAQRPEVTCRFRWQKNSLAMWDNRCTQHFALNDYQGFRRLMHRVTVDGDRPY
jgi:taurine dioxygenase